MDLYKKVIDHIEFDTKRKYKFHVAGSIYRGSIDPSDVDIIMVIDKMDGILHTLKSDLPMFIRRIGDRMVSFELILPDDKYYTPVQIWLCGSLSDPLPI